ncbi:integrase core domain-containing protein [Endozoicomonas sp. SESOKO2]|uniref:integrase core domain-containing protein n=1 Tax=Endozoicomonas sp. SESOKO2 TaxID=2828743 RepID=UPI0035A1ABB4
MAVRKRRLELWLVFHIDRGVEYRATEIQRLHKRYGFIVSINRPGRCSDNAEMESFFHTLKGELVTEETFWNIHHLRDAIAGYVQHFYNRARLHSGC